MKKIALLAAACLLMLPVGSAVSAHPASPAAMTVTKTVQMTNSLTFVPKVVKIHKGDKVKWVNASDFVHTSTGNGGTWNSKNVVSGGTFTRTFGSVGTFRYHCKYHKSSGMTGKVIVQA